MTLTDNSRMPFGEHKNEKMANVPASYLLWLYESNKSNKEVREYIEDNMNILLKEHRTKMLTKGMKILNIIKTTH